MQELLYTSVPRGLKPGSRGFCTVLSTQNMVAPLAVALEGLSAYRPVFPIGHARVAENPVVYSHLKLQVAGKSWYVLSRVADYGLDYSQRTNKLAHHLVLDKSELPTAGPASLLRTAGIMRESWEGDPKVVPPKPISRQPSTPTGVCLAWKDMTGDAGWAGVLAESFLKDSTRPVILLFEPGQDLRPLIDESLSLLPPEKRWDVTFSTYFTGSSQGITCLWRGIVLGSKEATESLRFVNALRIDLTSTDIGRAAGGELVEAARKGIRPTARPTLPPKQTASREQQPQRVVVLDNVDESAASQAFYEPADMEPHATPITNHDHSQAPPRLTRSAFKFANVPRETDVDDPGVRTSRTRRFVIVLLVVGSLVGVVFLGSEFANKIKSKPQEVASQAPTKDANETASAKAKTDDKTAKMAAEADANRLAMEADAQKKTAEKETQRLAMEAETKRLAMETEAKKKAEEAEAQRLTKETEAKRLAMELDAKKTAEQEAVKKAAEQPAVFDIFNAKGRAKQSFEIELSGHTSDDVTLKLLIPRSSDKMSVTPKETASGIAIVSAIIGGDTQQDASLTIENRNETQWLCWKIINENAGKDSDRLALLQLSALQVGEKNPRLFRFREAESHVLKKGPPLSFISPFLKSARTANVGLNYGTLKLTASTKTMDSTMSVTSIELNLAPSNAPHGGFASWELASDELEKLDLTQLHLWIAAKPDHDGEFEIRGRVVPKSFSKETETVGKKVWEKAGDKDKNPPLGKDASANEKNLETYLGKLGPLLKNVADKQQRTEEEESRFLKLTEIKNEIDSVQQQIRKALSAKEAIEKAEAIETSISFTHKLNGKSITLKLIEIKGGGK